MVSFGQALDQLARSGSNVNLSDLFQRLSFDDFDKLLFSCPLLTCPQQEIIEQGEERYNRLKEVITNFIYS